MRGRGAIVITLVAALLTVSLVWAIPAGAATRTVKMMNGPARFAPKAITIAKGDKVKWVNKGSTDHTATKNGGGWNSGALEPGESYTRTFKKKGTFSYHCNIHVGMTGKIVVT